MREHVCGSLATETSVKHCAQFLLSSHWGKGEPSSTLKGQNNSWNLGILNSGHFTSISIPPPLDKLLRNEDWLPFHFTWLDVRYLNTLLLPLNTYALITREQGASTHTPLYPVHVFVLFSLSSKNTD